MLRTDLGALHVAETFNHFYLLIWPKRSEAARRYRARPSGYTKFSKLIFRMI